MDVPKKESQIYILTEAGELIERRVYTEPQRFAVVALARRLAGILYALLRDGSVFDPGRSRHPGAAVALPA